MNKITHKVRCEQWTSIIKECLASGMPKTTWCREHGISDKSFFYWQRILREEAYLTTLESTLTPAVKRIQLQQLQILLKSKWLIKQVHLPVLLNRMLLSEEALFQLKYQIQLQKKKHDSIENVVEDIKENSATLDSALIPKHAQN